MQIIGSSKELLKKILVSGEFDEYPVEKHMHGTARMVEMLNQYSDELRKCGGEDLTSNFLMKEIKILEEAKGITLPNFLPRNAFLILLQGKVKDISGIPIGFVEKIWCYIEDVMISVLTRHSESYYQLQLCARRAGHNLIAKMKERSIKWMMEMVEMEKQTDYTCNPDYVTEWNKLMIHLGGFIHGVLEDKCKPSRFVVGDIGLVEVNVLRQYSRDLLSQAFDLKLRMIAYWKVVLRRLVDSMALHLKLSVANLVNQDMEVEIVSEVMGTNYGDGIQKMLEESPSVALRREKFKRSNNKLKESKEVVGKIIDGIITNGDRVLV